MCSLCQHAIAHSLETTGCTVLCLFIGTKLILAIERESQVERYELFTSDKSIRNLRLYERLGYTKFREQIVAEGLIFIYMEKYLNNRAI